MRKGVMKKWFAGVLFLAVLLLSPVVSSASWWLAAKTQPDVNPTDYTAEIEVNGVDKGRFPLIPFTHPEYGDVWKLVDVSDYVLGEYTFRIRWVNKTNEFIRSVWSDPFVFTFGRVGKGGLLLVTEE